MQLKISEHGPALHLIFILLAVITVRAVDIGPDKVEMVLGPRDVDMSPRAAPSAQMSTPFNINGGGTGQAIADGPHQGNGNVVEGAGAGAVPAADATKSTNSASTTPSCAAAPTATTGSGNTPQEDRYIKIAGILVPAIVAIGLGIAGMIVTLHVNAPRRDEDSDYHSSSRM